MSRLLNIIVHDFRETEQPRIMLEMRSCVTGKPEELVIEVDKHHGVSLCKAVRAACAAFLFPELSQSVAEQIAAALETAGEK